jgi:hypothetical protein
VLEVTFNTFTTERLFRLGQNDRADDLMTGNLRSQKHFPVRKLRVGEFHELTAWTHIFPFILHLFDLALVSHAPFFTPLFLTPGSEASSSTTFNQGQRATSASSE